MPVMPRNGKKSKRGKNCNSVFMHYSSLHYLRQFIFIKKLLKSPVSCVMIVCLLETFDRGLPPMLISQFPAANKYPCKRHHLFSLRRHSSLLIKRPAAEPAGLIFLLDDKVQTLAVSFMLINNPPHSSLDFSI